MARMLSMTSLMAAALIIGSSSRAADLLINGDFEEGSGEPRNPYGISSWTGFGNQERSAEHVLTGNASLKLFGGRGQTGLYHVAPLLPGRRLHAYVSMLSPSGDEFGGTARAGIRLEFLGPSEERLEFALADGETPVDLWHGFTTTIVSPPAIGIGRFVCFWADGDDPSGSIYWDSVAVTEEAYPVENLLFNQGFEQGKHDLADPFALDEWIAFGNAAQSYEVALDGAASLKLFGGPWSSGAYQDFRYDPGYPLSVSAQYATVSQDAIAGTAISGVTIEWPEPIIGVAEELSFGAFSQVDTWEDMEIVVYPPAGSIAVRFVSLIVDGQNPSGAVYVDDASLVAVLPGDVNDDGRINGEDIAGFTQALLDPASVPYQAWAAADIGGPDGPCAADGVVTLDDLPGFLKLLLNSACD